MFSYSFLSKNLSKIKFLTSRRPELLCKKVVLKFFQESQEKTPKACNLLKRDFPKILRKLTSLSSCNFL